MVRLGSGLNRVYRDMTAFMDYRVRPRFDAGTGEIPQVMYPMLIQSRLAAKRSLNEFLEILMRDPLGAVSWLWGIPIGQKLYIAKLVKPEIRDLLITKTKMAVKPTDSWLTKLAAVYHNSPLRWELQPSSSLKHRIEQLKRLQATMPDSGKAALTKTIDLMEAAKIQRDLATFLGFLITFSILGVGINIFNIYNTKKSVEAQKQRQQTQPMHLSA
jgi:hypothetical protein